MTKSQTPRDRGPATPSIKRRKVVEDTQYKTDAFLLLSLLLACNIIDVITTSFGLQMGLPEKNPVGWWLINTIGMQGLTIIKVSGCVALFLFIPKLKPYNIKLIGFACVLYVMAVINNLWKVLT